MNQAWVPLSQAALAGAVRSGTPILYAALGETLAERAGVLNLGLDGIMLVGAFAGASVSYHTGRIGLALAAAIVAGGLFGALHALFTVGLRGNQVVSGLALTVLGTGVTAYLGIPYVGKKITALMPENFPLLSRIPVLGPILFQQDLLVYASYPTVAVIAFLLYRTRFGLEIRAAGEDPETAAASGARVALVRCIAVIVGAALAGLGGAYLSLVYAQGWIENMTAGRGLISIGLVIFARWDPVRAMLGAYLFGLSWALQLLLQTTGLQISTYLLGMAPYLLMLIVLILTGIRYRKGGGDAPAALARV